jgi:hypothetical protein
MNKRHNGMKDLRECKYMNHPTICWITNCDSRVMNDYILVQLNKNNRSYTLAIDRVVYKDEHIYTTFHKRRGMILLP